MTVYFSIIIIIYVYIQKLAFLYAVVLRHEKNKKNKKNNGVLEVGE